MGLMKQYLISPILLLFGVAGVSVHAQDRWDMAAEEIVRLSPMVFENVPLDIRQALSDQGCSIPQTHIFWGIDRPHNIVLGEFAAPGQTDWAALCSHHARSTIIVFWGGPARCPPLAVERPDRSSLQTMGPHGILFSRGLFPVPASALVRPPVAAELANKLSHDAISDAFLDK